MFISPPGLLFSRLGPLHGGSNYTISLHISLSTIAGCTWTVSSPTSTLSSYAIVGKSAYSLPRVLDCKVPCDNSNFYCRNFMAAVTYTALGLGFLSPLMPSSSSHTNSTQCYVFSNSAFSGITAWPSAFDHLFSPLLKQ